MSTKKEEPDQPLLHAARNGDPHAREELLAMHRQRLKRMVAYRLDPVLAARIDSSDVVQDALIVAAARLDEYLANPGVAFYPWLRGIACDRLIDSQRRHIGAQRRSVLLEHQAEDAPVASDSPRLAEQLAGAFSTPSEQAVRKELHLSVRAALEALSPMDREVLSMRYLEHLKTSEIAALLGVSERTVQLRHGRAIQLLQKMLADQGF